MTFLSCFGGGRRTVAVEIFFPDSSKLIVDYSVSFEHWNFNHWIEILADCTDEAADKRFNRSP